MENPQHIKLLYEKYLNNDFSEQELDELLEYFHSSGEHHELSEMIRAELASEESEYQSHPAVQALLAELDRDLFVEIEKRRAPVKTVRLWPKIAITAAAVAAVVVGVWFYTSRHLEGSEATRDLLVNDIAPGKNGATITLANGKVIQLSDSKTGVVVGKDIKYDDGTTLSGLQPSLPEGERSIALTASTAKGQMYQFTLPDGTKVWLNADSKLEFPSSFMDNKTRFVKLSGEGYFEVAKDREHPFIVQTDKQEVEVLGTHFNINSYADEVSVKTTLLEGSVRVNDVILKPNQQSIIIGNTGINVQTVNAEDAIDWKTGHFVFSSESLGSIMRKVGRWYNVKVIYKDKVQDKTFSGAVSRFDNVSTLLKMLETTGRISFEINGNQITVKNK